MKLLKQIWSQSKVPLIILLAVLVIGQFAIRGKYARTDLLLTGVGLNVDLSEEGIHWIREDLALLLNAERKEEAAFVNTEMESFATTKNDNAYYLMKNIQTLIRQDSLDYFVMDKAGMENLIGQNMFLDLSTFFTGEELAAMEADLIWAVEAPEEEGAEVDMDARRPVAVRVGGMPFFRDNSPVEELYFAISSESTRLEACRILWEQLLAWGS